MYMVVAHSFAAFGGSYAPVHTKLHGLCGVAIVHSCITTGTYSAGLALNVLVTQCIDSILHMQASLGCISYNMVPLSLNSSCCLN